MKKTYTFALALTTAFAFSPMVALAQDDTTSDVISTAQDDAETQAAAEQAAAEAKRVAAAEKKAAFQRFNEARKALRAAKTEDASAADLDVIATEIAAGNTSAMVALGDYLISRDAVAAIGNYEAAMAAGDTKGSFGLARAYWAGRFVEKDREKAVTLIKQAVDADDRNAIMAYANWLSVLDKENGVEQALSLIESKIDVLDPERIDPLVAQIKLRGPLDFSMRDTVESLIATLPENRRDLTIFTTLGKDKNLYVWLMQDVLAKRGLYSGSRNGLLTNSTARGFARLCSQLDISSDCVRGPLYGLSARAVSNALRAEAEAS